MKALIQKQALITRRALITRLGAGRTLLTAGFGLLLLASVATAGVKSTITTTEPLADGPVVIEVKHTNTGIKITATANILDADTKEEKAKKIKDAINAAALAAGAPEKDLWAASVAGNVVTVAQVGGGGMKVTILKDKTKEGNKLTVEPSGGNSEHGFWKWVRSWLVSSNATIVPSGMTMTVSADTPTGYWTEVIVSDGTQTVAQMQADLTVLAAAHGYIFSTQIVPDIGGDRMELTSNGLPLGSPTLLPGVFQVETSPNWPELMGTMGVAMELEDIGFGFCYGDGSAQPCPCGNFGAPGHGCANSVAPGARLFADGLASVNFDMVQLITVELPPNKPSLFFQGQNPLNGGNGVQFGDGLRCVGGAVIRLQVVISDGAGNALSNLGVAQAGGMQPGNPGFYQCWYRDPNNGPCGTGFNVSNGYIIEWMP